MPGQIAQLIIPDDGGGRPWQIVPDWDRGKLYFLNNLVIRSYRIALETQTPILSSFAYTTYMVAATLDPLTGALLVNRPPESTGTLTNAMPIYRLDPDTFAVTGSFGRVGTFPSWPNSFWIPEAMACVGCGTLASGGATQVSYCVIKESAFSGYVGVFRIDTMQQAGFHQWVVSQIVDNRAHLSAGASGPDGASVFLTWNAASPTPTIPLYTVTISPGAETYDSASWPAVNPYIHTRVVGTIAATSVDPTWTNLATGNAPGYDASDGNVLLRVYTNDAVTTRNYMIKVDANTGAILWTTPLPTVATLTTPGLSVQEVDHEYVAMIGTPAYGGVTTDTGALTTNIPFGGISWNSFKVSSDQIQSIASDTAGLYLMYVGNFNGAAANAPVPVAGTPAHFTGSYAWIGGLIPPPPTGRLALDNLLCIVDVAPPAQNLISLRWSDDGGHTYGHPISQSLGGVGEYIASIQWQRLAFGRDRVWELAWSVPCSAALVGAWIDVTPGQS